MSLEARLGGITKVQSDFLKMGASEYGEKFYLEFCSCGRENPGFYQALQFNRSSRN